MSTIRMIYLPNPDGTRHDPGFPATDQHPDAKRYPFDHPVKGALNVDAINGPPVQAEIDAVLTDQPVPPSEVKQLATLLVQKGVLQPADAATFDQAPVAKGP